MINPDKIKAECQQVIEQLQQDEAAFEQGQKQLTALADQIKIKRGAIAAFNRAIDLDEKPQPTTAGE